MDFCRTTCKHLNGTPFIFSCHQPLCFFCSHQRKRRLDDRWGVAAASIIHPQFLTLTLRGRRHLAGVRSDLAANFRRMRRLQHFQERCAGGFYCLEFSYSRKRDLFHPHLHALIDADGLTSSWLSRSWKGYTSAYVVDLRTVPKDEIKRTFLYMLKGPCSSLEPRAVSEVYSSLGGAPLFQAFGIVTRRHGLCSVCRDKSQIGFGETCGHARHWK
ncbi:MAG TPA: hypothetical protein DCZ01_03700 [Elusimicrobia bacterium]|nr:MAG: hypothetical protein A2X37_05955 [Elusimicrobia bacterium GWA2_66_18]OGR70624.1 MAG: hypothetical protein A2X40_07635 [Elusimicrobia bacterium GWC2_65_9]HAZ07632.1 hypothetical protein [Elusimicrobiota bacterium]